MALYRANPADGIVWITGGATGIGRAVALHLAERGFTVVVTGRPIDPPITGLQAAKPFEGRLFDHPCDVRDADALAETVAAIEETHGPIALALLNAGQYLPVDGDRMTVGDFRQSYDVNVFGMINALVPVAERMRRRGGGQIALMGSVTAYLGLPSSAAYGSTKAAINILAESLRYDFDRDNIRLQVINPGFVRTPMTRDCAFVLPGMLSVNQAATRIVASLGGDRFEVNFPRRLSWPLKLLRIAPQRLRMSIVRKMARPPEGDLREPAVPAPTPAE